MMGGVKGANGVLETERMPGGDGLATLHQVMKLLFHDLTIALGIGIGQGGPFYRRESR
jgi:hypothetical protein